MQAESECCAFRENVHGKVMLVEACFFHDKLIVRVVSCWQGRQFCILRRCFMTSYLYILHVAT